jgi:hypothetical protein
VETFRDGLQGISGFAEQFTPNGEAIVIEPWTELAYVE